MGARAEESGFAGHHCDAAWAVNGSANAHIPAIHSRIYHFPVSFGQVT
jgi:hypothetical protein